MAAFQIRREADGELTRSAFASNEPTSAAASDRQQSEIDMQKKQEA